MTRRFVREQFHKMEGANAGEVILKMAAMAEIRKAHETKEKCRLSVAYQLICRESTLVKVKKDNITGKVFESVIKIDGLQSSRHNETLLDSSYVEDDTEIDSSVFMNSMIMSQFYVKTKIQLEDEDMRVWMMLHELPSISPEMAYGVCALNVAIPGSGTMVAALQSNRQTVRQT